MLRRSVQTGRQRRGMILIVVLSLLTLFTIVGISFVLVASSQEKSAKLAREGEQLFRPDLDPEGAASFFFGQLVYDVEDDETGIYSGLRGHSFARTMYGYNDATISLNDKAYSGVGRLRIPIAAAGVNLPGASGPAQYLGYLVNHTYRPGDGFLIDPERASARATGGNLNPGKTGRGAYINGAVPYTYPDHNNFFLASAVFDAGTGQYRVVCPSFHRPWLFGDLGDPANANWTNAQGKYLTLRPRPADMSPAFPYPEDAGGDVKNLLGAPGGNDSIWIDIGAPVMTSADGRKYKPLFAPLILDLDGRVNLNVHGNLRAGPGTGHASSQGWGPWEVNPFRVLSANAAEVRQLFHGYPTTGAARVVGRYGHDRQPGVNNPTAPGGSTPRVWGQVDFDAIDAATSQMAASRFLRPGEAGTLPYQPYPNFPAAYANGSAAEALNHPLLYNPFRDTTKGVVTDDRRFPASHMVALLRQRGTGSQGLTSDLLALLPNNLNNDTIRHRVTTHSADIDRPGAVPYVWNPDLAWNAANGYPSQPTVPVDPFNAVAGNRGATPAGSEFDATNWTSMLARKLRVNLNRALTPYPQPDAATGVITDMAAYNNAWADRRLLCADLYDRLVVATGAPAPGAGAPNDDNFRIRRWLAQLAVNIVDFIDEDDYITLYPWDTNFPNEHVYGTEQPSLVINEGYAQLDNVANDTGIVGVALGNRMAQDGFRINCWAELYNPRVSNPLPPPANNGIETINTTTRDAKAWLVVNNQSVYQLVVASYANNTQAAQALADPDNVTGTATFGAIAPNATSTVDFLTATVQNVLPADNKFGDPAETDGNAATTPSNDGFYIVGPDNVYLPFPDGMNDPNVQQSDPTLPATHRTPQMRLSIPAGADPTTFHPSLLLRRLACPHLPPGANNPYITVDVMHLQFQNQNLAVRNDARSYTATGANAGYVAVNARRTLGRFQPFEGEAGRQQLQAPNPAQTTQPQHTFYRHNYELPTAPALNAGGSTTFKTSGFDWLAHLDRQVVSPIELLHVSAWKPHQLTEKFVQAGVAHKHAALWTDPTTRLARFLEFVQTAPRMQGVTAGGRLPGKININTMNHLDVFRALCDAQPGNAFTDAQVRTVYNQILAYRTPAHATNSLNPPDPTLSATPDRPFWSLAVGASAGNDQWTAGPRGLEQTLLAPVAGGNANSARLFDPFGGAAHPYHNLELLNKIYNNVTTRSNVFAVWVTVGYFEVTNENTRPVQLGAEIGRAEGRHIRHRFFAIIDRTKMEAIRFNGAFVSAVNPQPGTTSYAVFGAGVSTANANTGKTWTLAPGAILTFNPEQDYAETTAVESDGAGGLRGVVRQSYTTTPMPIIQYGNPGPWTHYDPKKDPCMLYFGLID